MAVVVDQEITDQGVATFGSILKVDHVAASITTLGQHSALELTDSDHFLRAGWISLGVNLDQGIGSVDYWTGPQFLNWTNTIWAPPSDLFAFFERIRWSLSSGTVAWLRVET